VSFENVFVMRKKGVWNRSPQQRM